MAKSDYVWVPGYQVAGHLRSRPGLLPDSMGPRDRASYERFLAQAREWRPRDPETPSSFRLRPPYAFDSQYETEAGDPIERQPVDLTDRLSAYLFDALGPTMVRFREQGQKTHRRVFCDRHDPSVRVFIAMATPSDSKYWFWVKCYAEPLLNAVRNSFLLFGCKDRPAYYLLPWHEFVSDVTKAHVVSGNSSSYSCPISDDLLNLSADLKLDVAEYLCHVHAVTPMRH